MPWPCGPTLVRTSGGHSLCMWHQAAGIKLRAVSPCSSIKLPAARAAVCRALCPNSCLAAGGLGSSFCITAMCRTPSCQYQILASACLHMPYSTIGFLFAGPVLGPMFADAATVKVLHGADHDVL